MAAKVDCITEDEGFCYVMWRHNRGWDEPCKVKEGDSRNWVLENFWDVADLVIVNGKCMMGVVVDVETKGLDDSVKNTSSW